MIERSPEQETARLAGLHSSPKTGHFETHIHARSYLITAPDGTDYFCRNLRLWVDEHLHLLDGTPDQAYNGFMSVRAGRARTWRGWRVVEWGE